MESATGGSGMTGLPADVAQRIHAHLDAIAREFKPGAKLTLLVRNEVGVGLDADCVVTNDTLPDAIAGLQRRAALDLDQPQEPKCP